MTFFGKAGPGCVDLVLSEGEREGSSVWDLVERPSGRQLGRVLRGSMNLDLQTPPPWRYLLQTLRHVHGTLLLYPCLRCDLREATAAQVEALHEAVVKMAEDRGIPLLAWAGSAPAGRVALDESLPALGYGRVPQISARRFSARAEGFDPFVESLKPSQRRRWLEGLEEGRRRRMQVSDASLATVGTLHRRLYLQAFEGCDPRLEPLLPAAFRAVLDRDPDGLRLLELREDEGELRAWLLYRQETEGLRVVLSASGEVSGRLARAVLFLEKLFARAEEARLGRIDVEAPGLGGEVLPGGIPLPRDLFLRHRDRAVMCFIRRLEGLAPRAARPR